VVSENETLDDLFVFAGESNQPLAEKICESIGVPLRDTKFDRFSNDNIWIQLGESVRGKDVYIIQSLTEPVSDHLMQLLMMINVARVGDARRVTAVIPHYSYARSDKKDAPRICITARLVADLIQTSGADRVITMTLHSDQVHGFFSVPLDHLTSQSVFVKHFDKYKGTDTMLVSPDVGYAKHVVHLARDLKLPVAITVKERLADDYVRIDAVLGMGHIPERVIIVDDEIATGSSMKQAIEAIREKGAKEFIVACTHGILSQNATSALLEIKGVTEIVVTDTVLLDEEVRLHKKVTVLSLASVLGEGILRNHKGQSMGSLFTFWKDSPETELSNQ
jgi:ribose-phosphate pyrophosphokinase